MHLQKLSLFNFKNYGETLFEFSPQANCFTGLNGKGKTNVLDAIYYLCMCKSFFNATDSLNIKHNEVFFTIHGTFTLNENTEDIFCGLKQGHKKVFKRNQKEYNRLAEHIGLLPVVMVAPVDQELITGGSEERRKFMDSIICQYDKVYLDDLTAYQKILQQRNALLKQMNTQGYFEAGSLQIWDEQLIGYATRIYATRQRFVTDFVPLFNRFYQTISSSAETVDLTYESHLHQPQFEEQLHNALKRDRALQFTTVGTHKDDLVFRINQQTAKRFGSQGQQKSVVLALKLAQFDLLKNARGLKPVLLLDDVFDKLDETRVSKLMELVSHHTFGQLFITDTNADRVLNIFKSINTTIKNFTLD